jgi:RNA polymerase primary sigma factor
MDLSNYYDSILKEPLLGKEEEKDLFLELQDEGLPDKRKMEIRDRIIRANLRFVFKEAKRYSKNDPNMFAELISAGNEGLLVGLEKYNPDSGYRFLTYVGWWVKQRILHHMSTQRLVSLPIWRQQLAARIQKVVEANPEITFETLKGQFSDVPEKDLKELFETQFLTFYIEDIGEDPAFEINPIETEVDNRLDQEKISSIVSKLSPLEKQIIEMSFGLVDGEEKKPSEIMQTLNISKETLKNVRRDALLKLKASLGDSNPFK